MINERPRHFLRADFEKFDVDLEADLAPSWTSRTHRLRRRSEFILTDNGEFIVPSGGLFRVGIRGTLVAPDLQPVDPWLVQIYFINQLTGDAVGTLQLTELGDFGKQIGVVGPARIVARVYTANGKVRRLTLPNRAFQSKDLRIDDLQIDARNVGIDPSDEVTTLPKVEVRAPQVQPRSPGRLS